MNECPKCGYTRTPEDLAPNYECPACGVIYDKYVKAQAAKAERDAALAAEQRDREIKAALQAATTASKKIPSAAPPRSTKSHRKLATACAIIGALALFSILAPTSPRDTEPPQAAVPPAPPVKPRQMTPEEQVAAAVARQEEIERKRVEAFVVTAREVCETAIRRNASFPSTVDIAWLLGTATQRTANSTRVRMEFTAKNALGAELPFVADCLVNDIGTLSSFRVNNR